MGRVTRWFKKLFSVKKKKIYIEEKENSMRRSVDQPPNIPADISAIDAAWLRSFYPELEKEHKKHIANVTAAAALKIQTCYRRYLARKAVVALKELEINKGRTTNTCCCNTPMPNPTPREETEYASSSSSTTELNSGEYFFSDLTFCRTSSMSSNIDNNYSFGENDQLVQELSNFRLLRWLGSGSSGNVYLCQLRGPSIGSPNENLYAMKVVDRLASRNKLQRAEIEKEILGMLHHPFLPTLYAQFDSSHYSCFVMEYCPGGDLHNVRLRQPNRRFNVSSAKFYAAETFLALEYLHIMGIVYRDLKPENVLVRDDGHIMLSDFDLSLKCASRFKTGENIRKRLHIPSCASQIQRVLLSCLPSNKKGANYMTTMTNTEDVLQGYDPELVAEPINARSKSFVGTNEYLAPEMISRTGHGSAVDWWTFGVFLYEMLYGVTPFKGENSEKTLTNIMKKPLTFPSIINVNCSSGKEVEEIVKAQDLISKLLVKNPKKRIGSLKGSVEIKQHEFFKDVDWALIKSVRPPEVPKDLQKFMNKYPSPKFNKQERRRHTL